MPQKPLDEPRRRGIASAATVAAAPPRLADPRWSHAEIVRARPATSVEEALLKGGYPELHARPEIDARDFFRSYVATYLERDLRAQLQVGSLRDFERFLRAAALRTAQLLKKGHTCSSKPCS
jgi:hypothetical protein